ncbi:hypothetical protein JW935_19495 [candidate division KSB1 bacterium]|nr:hypothetical protein [candidate division KSB1 bacterium]
MSNIIESYAFGSMTVKGNIYRRDLIVFPHKILPDWWREKGHLLSLDDLKDVLAYEPNVAIIGCGAMSKMKIADNVWDLFAAKSILFLAGATGKMVNEFNRQLERGEKVAGAFHLTC